MNAEKAKRRQSLKVLISESIMVITVILTVTILAFVVSGYWINSDFTVERNGLLQISSTPTGADVSIDGESAWLQRTNTSKVLSSGEHTITLSKEGYDSWSKTINISEGLLYKIHYPRLFLQNRSQENILDVSETAFATISPDHSLLVLINNTAKWNLINLNDGTINPQEIDIAKTISDNEYSVNKILKADWDHNNSHILFKIRSNNDTKWILLDVKNPSNSINLTREFDSNFDDIKILDNNSNNLLAVQDNNLRKIDVSAKSLSAILIENILDFDHYNDNEIIFSAQNNNPSAEPYYIGLLKLSDNKITTLKETNTSTKVTISKFYDDKYITILEDNILSLYKKENFELLNTFELTFSPNIIKVGHDGEFITAFLNNKIATLDMEAMSITEWQTDGESFGWIDNDMIYSVKNGELIVYDYDSLNRRAIANNASEYFPATITNNKWLYYFSNNSLIRETIAN